MPSKKKAKGLDEMGADELRALKGEKRVAAAELVEEQREIQTYITAIEAAESD